MSVSNGNNKLGDKVGNVSVIPVVDCQNCFHCYDKCYAKKFFKMYPSTKKSWTENSELYKSDPDGYFYGMIESYLKKKNPKYFRWHVGGDIIDQGYLHGMKELAFRFPKVKFVCFTKRFDLNYYATPNNLKIFFSMWPGQDMPAIQANVRMAWLQDGSEKRIPKGSRRCPNKCVGCMSCWNQNRDVVFHLHK